MGLLYATETQIDEHISIPIPTLEQIIPIEEMYYRIVETIIATPYDLMVQLDDAGVDFSQITDFDLFLLMYKQLASDIPEVKDTLPLVIKGIDFNSLEITQDDRNHELILQSKNGDVVIDKFVHYKICSALREIHGIPKTAKKPGNEEARKYMIQRARVKQQRAARKKNKPPSILEDRIVALVSSPEFKYDFDTVRKLTIYQFTRSVAQVIKRVDFNNVMIGICTGNIDAKDLNKDVLNWMSS